MASQRAMTLDSTAADVRLAHARVLAGQFRLADALRAVDGAIASDSTSLFAWHLKGQLLRGLGQQEAAGVALRQELALDRLAPVVHIARSGWFLDSRMNDSAIASAERAVALAPDEPKWSAQLSASYIAGGRTDDAIRLCSARTPKDVCTALFRGMASDPAYTSAAWAIAKSIPTSALSLSERAGLLAQLGDTAAAFDALQRAIALRDASSYLSILSPSCESMHRDPRWAAIVRTVRGDSIPR